MKKIRWLPLLLALCLLSGCGSRSETPAPAPAPVTAPPAAPAIPGAPAPVTPAPDPVAEAAAMRLERTEGAVTLTDESGAELPILERMRLFSGSALATEAESLAGISLDQTKAATVDQESRAEIRQDGKKLTLTLTEGGVYFSVSRPLEADESFDIRTSSMTLGIRGTNGYVTAVSETEAVVILTSGKGVITAAGQEHPIAAGQQVTVRTDGETPFSDEAIRVSRLPTLLIDELRLDPEARERVEAEAGLDNEALDHRVAGEPFTETVPDERGYTVYEYDENGVPVRFVSYWEDGSERSHGILDALGRPIQKEISRVGLTGPFRELCLFTYAPDSPHVSIVWSRWHSYDESSPILNATRGLEYTMSAPENHVDVDAMTSVSEGSDHMDVDRITIQEYAPDGTLLSETDQ